MSKINLVAALALGSLLACSTIASAQDSTRKEGEKGGGSAANVDRKPSVTKDACIALFKQVVRDVNQQKFDKVFTNICDGKRSPFKIMEPSDFESMKKADGDRAITRNFRKYDLIEKSFDTITYKELEGGLDDDCEVKLGDRSGKGALYKLEISIDLEGKVTENTTLRFVGFEGRLYWIPFGW